MRGGVGDRQHKIAGGDLRCVYIHILELIDIFILYRCEIRKSPTRFRPCVFGVAILEIDNRHVLERERRGMSRTGMLRASIPMDKTKYTMKAR